GGVVQGKAAVLSGRAGRDDRPRRRRGKGLAGLQRARGRAAWRLLPVSLRCRPASGTRRLTGHGRSRRQRKTFEGRMAIQHPYLLFLGDAPDQLAAKTAQGVAHWRPEWCVGQLRLDGCKADLGLTEMTLEEGRAAGAKTLIIGVANRGGVFSEAWITVLEQALLLGYDLAAGLHNRLADVPVLKAA